MSRLPNEDLFEGSKMTFGEHLEELRVALFKSMLGLAVGCVFGFLLANYVIDFITQPLEAALNDYYSNKMAEDIAARYGAGKSEDEIELLKKSVIDDGRVFDDIYYEESELRRLFGLLGMTPNTDAASFPTEPGEPDFSNMIKVRMWKDAGYKIQSIGTTEPFISWMKVGIVTGLTFAMPWIFYQIWIFVAEGLYPSEKKYVYIYLPFSLALFFLGAGIAFFFVFKPVLAFLFSFNDIMNSDPEPRISEWLNFFLLLPLGFGIGFQLPLVMLFLNRIGVLSVEVYLSQWRIAVLIIFFAAMLLTPADPQSMLLLAIPLTILYFLGILLCKYLPKSESPYGEGYDPI